MAEERIRVQLQLKNLKPLAGLDVDCSCMPRRRLEDGSIELTAVVSGETLKKLRRKRQIRVEVLADVAAEAAESAKQVSRINRYADGSLPDRARLEETRRCGITPTRSKPRSATSPPPTRRLRNRFRCPSRRGASMRRHSRAASARSASASTPRTPPTARFSSSASTRASGFHRKLRWSSPRRCWAHSPAVPASSTAARATRPPTFSASSRTSISFSCHA